MVGTTFRIQIFFIGRSIWLAASSSRAPPSVEYIEEIFKLLSSLKASGVFIEYSDTFPFLGKYEILKNDKRSYSQDEIVKIGALADKYSQDSK